MKALLPSDWIDSSYLAATIYKSTEEKTTGNHPNGCYVVQLSLVTPEDKGFVIQHFADPLHILVKVKGDKTKFGIYLVNPNGDTSVKTQAVDGKVTADLSQSGTYTLKELTN
jgi:hypothetical protein